MCSYELDPLDPDVKGKNFSFCIGSTYSALETFLVKKKIKGPCWVRIENIRNTTSIITNRKLEFKVDFSIDSNIKVLEE